MGCSGSESYEHPLYTHVIEEKDADAVAWAFVNRNKCVKFPFKFPPLSPKELRANILYLGICHSDVLTVREGWGPCQYPLAPGHEIIAEVSEETIIRKVCLKLRKGKEIWQIADELEEDEPRIKAICDAIESFAPDYDEEQVVEWMRKRASVSP